MEETPPTSYSPGPRHFRGWQTAPMWAFLGSVVVALAGIVTVWIQSNNNSNIIRLQEQQSIADYRDSVEAEKQKLQNKQAIMNRVKIDRHLLELQDHFPAANRVVIYKLHDHGGVMDNADPNKVTWLYEEVRTGEIPVKNDWQDRDLPGGWTELQARIIRGSSSAPGYYYLADMSSVPEIFRDRTRYHLEQQNTRAVLGIMIEEATDALYMLSIYFDRKAPIEDPNDFLLLRDYADRFKRLILTRQDPVR